METLLKTITLIAIFLAVFNIIALIILSKRMKKK